jgi:hypothetical protein
MDVINERRWLVLIFSVYLFLAAGYSLLMPVWEAPDEPAHYQIAWHLARIGRLPSLKLNYEMDQPKTFYYLGSWIIRGLDQIDPHYSDYYVLHEYTENIRVRVRRFDWTRDNYRFLLGVHLLRWLNILFGACALWLNWMAFRCFVPEQPILRVGALAFAALTPQYLHIMSSVSNDALGTLAGAFLFYLAIRLTTKRVNLLILSSIPLAIILPLTTKLTVLPVGAAVLITFGWLQISRTEQKKQLAFLGLAVLTIFLFLYFLFPQTVQPALGEIGWRLFSLHNGAFTPGYLAFIFGQIVWTYWGWVGWMAVSLPPVLIVFLTLFGTIGMLMNARNLIKTKAQNPQFNAWIVTWLIALSTLAAVARNALTTGATQGRFLFPAIGVLSLLMISGWYERLPQKFQRYVPMTVLIFMLLCNLILWQFGILPVYYQPFLD